MKKLAVLLSTLFLLGAVPALASPPPPQNEDDGSGVCWYKVTRPDGSSYYFKGYC